MSFFKRAQGAWVVRVNKLHEVVMHPLDDEGQFASGHAREVLKPWIEAVLRHKLHYLRFLCDPKLGRYSAVYTLSVARSKNSSDRRGIARYILEDAKIYWSTKEADEECAKIDALMKADDECQDDVVIDDEEDA